jgi:Flp pilus assembly protein TadB
MVIGLSGGLPPAQALAAAAGEVDHSVGGQVRAVLRRAARTGLAAALAEGEGPAGELFRRLAGAQASGAPTAAAVLGFVDARRAERRSRMLTRIRSLPVTLSIPVALLLLPGFVLTVVGPTVVERAGDLYGPLVGR